MRRLTLSSTDIKIAGVCAGIAEYFQIDPTIVRIIWLCILVLGFFFSSCNSLFILLAYYSTGIIFNNFIIFDNRLLAIH